jgi:hypothetical protein
MSDDQNHSSLSTTADITPWATLKVPGASEAYFRLGYRNRSEESRYLDLCVPHAPDKPDGVFFGTDGDFVQVVKRSAATRILEGNYSIYVQDDETIAHASATDATNSTRTYRSYFRLGKPESPLEGVLGGTAAVEDVRLLVGEFLPTALATNETRENCASLLAQAVTGASSTLGLSDEDKGLVKADSQRAARTALETKARYADRRALEHVLMAFDQTAGGDDAEKADARSWANGVLRRQLPFHLRNAYLLEEPAGSRARLVAYAKDGSQPGRQGSARRAIAFVAETRATGVATGGTATEMPSGLTAHRTPQEALAWVARAKEQATAHLKELDKLSGELLDRYTLGNGVALYSDRGIALNTPSQLAVTVGSDSRTVFGPTFSIVYDVDDATIAKIKSGEIASLADVPEKRIVTATKVDRDLLDKSAWRTTRIDRAKTLTYSCNDTGAFSASVSTSATFGTRYSSGLSASFDTSYGFSGKASIAHAYDYGKTAASKDSKAGKLLKHDRKAGMKAGNVTIGNANLAEVAANVTRMTWTNVVQGMLAASLALQAAYTLAITGQTLLRKDENDETIKARMVTGEEIYLAIAMLQTIGLIGSIVMFMVESSAEKAAMAEDAVKPFQQGNITINGAGIKLQAGTSYIEITATGIMLNGTAINCNSPLTLLAPVPVPSPASPVNTANAAALMASLLDGADDALWDAIEAP